MKLVTVKFPKQYEQSLSALHDCIFKYLHNSAHCIAVKKFSVNDAQFNQKNSSNILVIYWNESNKNKHMPITFQWKPYIGCQKHAPNITKWQREKKANCIRQQNYLELLFTVSYQFVCFHYGRLTCLYYVIGNFAAPSHFQLNLRAVAESKKKLLVFIPRIWTILQQLIGLFY